MQAEEVQRGGRQGAGSREESEELKVAVGDLQPCVTALTATGGRGDRAMLELPLCPSASLALGLFTHTPVLLNRAGPPKHSWCPLQPGE